MGLLLLFPIGIVLPGIWRNCSRIRGNYRARNCSRIRGNYRARNCAQVKSTCAETLTTVKSRDYYFLRSRVFLEKIPQKKISKLLKSPI